MKITRVVTLHRGTRQSKKIVKRSDQGKKERNDIFATNLGFQCRVACVRLVSPAIFTAHQQRIIIENYMTCEAKIAHMQRGLNAVQKHTITRYGLFQLFRQRKTAQLKNSERKKGEETGERAQKWIFPRFLASYFFLVVLRTFHLFCALFSIIWTPSFQSLRFSFSRLSLLSGRLEQANYPNSRRLEEGIGALILSDTIHIIKPSTMTTDNKNKIILILTSMRSTFHVGPVWV